MEKKKLRTKNGVRKLSLVSSMKLKLLVCAKYLVSGQYIF